MIVNWQDLKILIDNGSVNYRHIELSNKYVIVGFDDRFTLECSFFKDTEEAVDYEQGYKNVGARKTHTKQINPFADKTVPGYKLFRRVHGQTLDLAAEGSSVIEFTVPYDLCKINEIQTRWLPEGVTADFMVCHPIYGQLSQHAFNTPLTEGSGIDKSEYDATLQKDLILKMVFHNPTIVTKKIGVCWVLHEMVPV